MLLAQQSGFTNVQFITTTTVPQRKGSGNTKKLAPNIPILLFNIIVIKNYNLIKKKLRFLILIYQIHPIY